MDASLEKCSKHKHFTINACADTCLSMAAQGEEVRLMLVNQLDYDLLQVTRYRHSGGSRNGLSLHALLTKGTQT